jgi:hypothetical protein
VHTFYPSTIQQYQYVHFKSREIQYHNRIHDLLADNLTLSRCLNPALHEFVAWFTEYYGIAPLSCVARALAWTLAGADLSTHDLATLGDVHIALPFATAFVTRDDYSVCQLDSITQQKLVTWLTLVIQSTFPSDDDFHSSPFFTRFSHRRTVFFSLALAFSNSDLLTTASDTLIQSILSCFYVRCFELLCHVSPHQQLTTPRYSRLLAFTSKYLALLQVNQPDHAFLDNLAHTYGSLSRIYSLCTLFKEKGLARLSQLLTTYIIKNYAVFDAGKQKSTIHYNESFHSEAAYVSLVHFEALENELSTLGIRNAW